MPTFAQMAATSTLDLAAADFLNAVAPVFAARHSATEIAVELRSQVGYARALAPGIPPQLLPPEAGAAELVETAGVLCVRWLSELPRAIRIAAGHAVNAGAAVHLFANSDGLLLLAVQIGDEITEVARRPVLERLH